MDFATLPAADAEGALLAHSLPVGGGRWAKGRRLSAGDVAALAAEGIGAVTVARLAADDVGEDAAAGALAAALAGPGVTALAAAHGRANLAAAHAGVLTLEAAAVDAVNAVDEALTLGTLPPFARVAAGEIVATVKVIPYAVAGAALAAAAAAARPLRVHGFRRLGVELWRTRLPGVSDKALAKMAAVTRSRLAALDIELADVGVVTHAVEALAAALGAPSAAAITLVAGASATSDRRDVIPAAIMAAGGTVERLGMPVDPGNLLVLGRIGERRVIGLPGCARSPRRNGFDWVLERLVAGLTVTATDIAAMGVGGLLAEAERPQPRVDASAAGPARGAVGAVVLAAGRSTRFSGANKLLAALDGKPVLAHVLDALAAAGLPPPVVVLGHMADAVRAAADGRAARYITAPDHAAGLSRSLAAGIGAVPGGWRGALVCLADMPRVTPATYRALADAAVSDAAVAVPMFEGKRGNPVLWGRAWFARLARVSGDSGGDVGGRALLGEIGGGVTEVAVDDAGILADVDTRAALAALQ